MPALERLTLAFMQIPMTEEGRTELHKLVKEAEEEQGELVAALRKLEWAIVDSWDGRRSCPACKNWEFEKEHDKYCVIAKALARFPSPAPTGPTG